jgi:hypothetical protein
MAPPTGQAHLDLALAAVCSFGGIMGWARKGSKASVRALQCSAPHPPDHRAMQRDVTMCPSVPHDAAGGWNWLRRSVWQQRLPHSGGGCISGAHARGCSVGSACVRHGLPSCPHAQTHAGRAADRPGCGSVCLPRPKGPRVGMSEYGAPRVGAAHVSVTTPHHTTHVTIKTKHGEGSLRRLRLPATHSNTTACAAAEALLRRCATQWGRDGVVQRTLPPPPPPAAAESKLVVGNPPIGASLFMICTDASSRCMRFAAEEARGAQHNVSSPTRGHHSVVPRRLSLQHTPALVSVVRRCSNCGAQPRQQIPPHTHTTPQPPLGPRPHARGTLAPS